MTSADRPQPTAESTNCYYYSGKAARSPIESSGGRRIAVKTLVATSGNLRVVVGIYLCMIVSVSHSYAIRSDCLPFRDLRATHIR
jgi:hypothetical protein